VNPRLALLIGLTFLIDAAIYYGAPRVFGGHIDFAGLTMLIFLSAAMSIMFYVLLASTPRSQ
jgi:hypothetical protein